MTRSTIYEVPRISARPGKEIVPSTCGHNCRGRCVVNAHVQDGRIVRIGTDPSKWTSEMPPLTACVRGFGALERTAALPIAGPPSSSMAQRGQRPRRIGRGAFAPDQPLVGADHLVLPARRHPTLRVRAIRRGSERDATVRATERASKGSRPSQCFGLDK